MTFDPYFRFYREDPQERDFWMVEFEELALEARAELAHRREIYPQLIAKGRMVRELAEREIRVMAAIAWGLTYPFELRDGPRPPSTWAERVHALRREIALRRTFYPRWIAAGRMTEAEAKAKLERMETIHDYAWNEIHAEAHAARAETLAKTKMKVAA